MPGDAPRCQPSDAMSDAQTRCVRYGEKIKITKWTFWDSPDKEGLEQLGFTRMRTDGGAWFKICGRGMSDADRRSSVGTCVKYSDVWKLIASEESDGRLDCSTSSCYAAPNGGTVCSSVSRGLLAARL